MRRYVLVNPKSLILGAVCLLVGLAGCQSVQPATTVVDRQMVGQSKADGPVTPTSAASASSGPTYTVKKGDTLYSVALDNGLYYKDLQSWNGLDDPNRILIGQQLRLSQPENAAQTRTVQTNSVAQNQQHPVVEERALAPSIANSTPGKPLTEPKVAKQPFSAEIYARLQRNITSQNPNKLTSTTPPASNPPQVEPAKVNSETGNWPWPANGKVIGSFGESGGKGLDIAGSAGDPVKAVADGKVVYVGTGLRGYGQMVIIKHDSAHLTAYAHNQKLLVTEGQNVTQGQKIAEMGSSDSDRVKLHFEVRKQGKPVDPSAYLVR
jgi:lipoprotein NlpD